MNAAPKFDYKPLPMQNGKHRVAVLAGGPADIARDLTTYLAQFGVEVKYHWEQHKPNLWPQKVPADADFVILLKDFSGHWGFSRMKQACKDAGVRYILTQRKKSTMGAALRNYGLNTFNPLNGAPRLRAVAEEPVLETPTAAPAPTPAETPTEAPPEKPKATDTFAVAREGKKTAKVRARYAEDLAMADPTIGGDALNEKIRQKFGMGMGNVALLQILNLARELRAEETNPKAKPLPKVVVAPPGVTLEGPKTLAPGDMKWVPDAPKEIRRKAAELYLLCLEAGLQVSITPQRFSVEVVA